MFPELKRCSSVTNWGNKRSYLHLPLQPIPLFSFAYVAQKMDAGQPEHDRIGRPERDNEDEAAMAGKPGQHSQDSTFGHDIGVQ